MERVVTILTCRSFLLRSLSPSYRFGGCILFQPDGLDDLAWAIMHEVSKLCYRVSEADVTRACNQVISSLATSLFFFQYSSFPPLVQCSIFEGNLDADGISWFTLSKVM